MMSARLTVLGLLMLFVTAGPVHVRADSPPRTLRVASFNTALSRDALGQLASDLRRTDDPQARAIAEVIQRVRPDILLLNEFDFDATRDTIRSFQTNYLAASQHGAEPITYPYVCVPRVNTGVPAAEDLDRDGEVGGPGDAFGWGEFEGQFGMVLLSRFPMDMERSRTFRTLPWAAMPDSALPGSFYDPAAAEILRLSSKTHADIPIRIPATEERPERVLRALISHPTPPVFDGPEDRNGRRNHDEIRFWSLYLDGHRFRDDAGMTHPFPADAAFVILGDLNADPFDGDRHGDAINRLLGHPRVLENPTPGSDGGREAGERSDADHAHTGDPANDTAAWGPGRPGNLRVDYVLPGAGRHGAGGVRVVDAGVFWPSDDEPGAEAVKRSDHRLVWVDLELD